MHNSNYVYNSRVNTDITFLLTIPWPSYCTNMPWNLAALERRDLHKFQGLAGSCAHPGAADCRRRPQRPRAPVSPASGRSRLRRGEAAEGPQTHRSSRGNCWQWLWCGTCGRKAHGPGESVAVPCRGVAQLPAAPAPAPDAPRQRGEGTTGLTACRTVGKSLWISTETGAFILIYIVMKACNSTVS